MRATTLIVFGLTVFGSNASRAATLTALIDEGDVVEVYVNGKRVVASAGGDPLAAKFALPDAGWSSMKVVYRALAGEPENRPQEQEYRVMLRKGLQLELNPISFVYAVDPRPGDRCLTVAKPPNDTFWAPCGDFERPIPPGKVHRWDQCAKPGSRTQWTFVDLVRPHGASHGSPMIIDWLPGAYSVSWSKGKIEIGFTENANCAKAPTISSLPVLPESQGPTHGATLGKAELIHVEYGRQQVQPILTGLLGEVNGCQQKLLENPDAAAEHMMHVGLDVGPDGGVSRAIVTDSTSNDPTFNHCVERALSAASFPGSTDGGTGYVGVPLVFH